jgi:ribosomal protein S18 acetylase RimI-like enzyme
VVGELVLIETGDGRELLLPLLLLADESESQVRAYMQAGELFAWEVGGKAIGIVLAIPEADGAIEFKAVAIAPEWQGQGIGTEMLRSVIESLRDRGVQRVKVGTGNAGISQLAFYQKAGFRLSHIERDFFSVARGYPANLAENGIRLRDMVWMDLELA